MQKLVSRLRNHLLDCRNVIFGLSTKELTDPALPAWRSIIEKVPGCSRSSSRTCQDNRPVKLRGGESSSTSRTNGNSDD